MKIQAMQCVRQIRRTDFSRSATGPGQSCEGFFLEKPHSFSLKNIKSHAVKTKGYQMVLPGRNVFTLEHPTDYIIYHTVSKLVHSIWDCKYHVVWIPKYRRKELYGAKR